MENYISTIDNYLVNLKWIRFMKKSDNCYNICANPYGCTKDSYMNICKYNKDYEKVENFEKELLQIDNNIYINLDWMRWVKPISNNTCYKFCSIGGNCDDNTELTVCMTKNYELFNKITKLYRN